MISTIQPIDKESIHRICSGQVVLDLSSAMKELVENSIDAGATTIEIIFKDNGLGGLEVVDNGAGVDPSNYEFLALKHYTSKLVEFKDLEQVSTFGFRGEALSSLCSLADLVVQTATKDQAPRGVRLEYDHQGHLVSRSSVARSVGTTIQLSNLFGSLPVRLREFKRNIKRDYGKALSLIQAYGVISTGVRIVTSNQSANGSKMRVLSTTGNPSLRENVANIFGAKSVTQLVPFEVNLSSAMDVDEQETENILGCVTGLISKPEFGAGRQKSDRQYFYINGRPCHLPKMTKVFNEIYRSYVVNQYPFVVADFKIPTDSYDVNVSPDKRTIFMHNERKLVETIMSGLAEQLEPSRSTFDINPLLSLSDNASIAKGGNEDGHTRRTTRIGLSTSSTTASASATTTLSILESFAHKSGKAYRPSSASSKAPVSTSIGKRSADSTLLSYVKRPRETTDMEDDANDLPTGQIIPTDTDTVMDEENDNDGGGTKRMDNAVPTMPNDDGDDNDDASLSTATNTKIISRSTWRSIDEYVSVEFQLSHLGRKAPKRPCQQDATMATLESSLKNASIGTDDNELAAVALNRVISKEDFSRFQVIGQFNLGFIIGLLDGYDLFIIDQHAADEKYNFETLQATTRLDGQKLIRPQPIDLTASEELLVMDNMDIFRFNGFNIKVDEAAEPTKRISVLSQPFSKNTMLDKRDISELVCLIGEKPGEMVRCNRIRAMFASRACRKSVMIGDPLNRQQMTKVIRHMGEINQPWNCPHGRPTMRHLMTLTNLKTKTNVMHLRSLTCQGSLFSS
ncbi:hypothetical protein [Absidia glauca]|uniref:DNA mismatch repair protein PMS1 n=1 Tax=Absidia glauca TaxID=4829 RepID=A0A163KIU8_ABSGL|nr:hypothetical protein [Absidia glauca]